MALEDIRDKIYSDAEKEKENILNKANQKRDEILAEYKKKINEHNENALKMAFADGENIKRGRIIDAKIKYKNELLSIKKKFINDIISKTVDMFINSDEYQKTIRNALLKYSETGKEEVIISKKEKYISSKWLEKINQEEKTQFTLSDEIGNFFGGIVLKSGDIYINLSTDLLIEQNKESIEKELNRILF